MILGLTSLGIKFITEITRCSRAIEGEVGLPLELEATELCIFERNP